MPSRTSSQVESHWYPVTFKWFGGWAGDDNVPPIPQPESWVGNYLAPGVFKTFEAYDGPNPTNGSAWTNFTHYERNLGDLGSSRQTLPKVQGAWPNIHDGGWSGDFPPYAGWVAHNGAGYLLDTLPIMYTPVGSDRMSCIVPSDIGAITSKAIEAMTPGIKSELSSINSLIELRDFRTMARKAIATASRFSVATRKLPVRHWGRAAIADLYSGWKAYLSSLKKKTGSQLAGSVVGVAAENFLQWKFAVAPLISDVRAVRRALKSLEKKINHLVTNEGRVRTSHWSTSRTLGSASAREISFAFGGAPKFDEGPYLDAPNSSILRIAASEVEAQIHVELRYNYNLTQYQRENARLLALQDSLGVNFNPAIIWNAIRWTFLVDWMVNVSSYLDQFKVGHMEPKVNVLGALWSSRSTRSQDWSKTYSWDGMPGSLGMSLPRLDEIAYVRRVFQPDRTSFTTSGLSSSELTLGAALVIAVRRRKARK